MTSPAAAELVINGQVILTDEDGYLKNRDDWSEAVAQTLSAADGVELTESHWEVIRLLQEYFDNYEIAPAIRILTKAVGNTGNLGLPLCLLAFGEQGLAFAMAYFAVQCLLMFSIGDAIYAGRFSVNAMFRSPVLAAVGVCVGGWSGGGFGVGGGEGGWGGR